MRRFTARTFYKKDYIKLVLITNNKNTKVYYEIPSVDSNTISLKQYGISFTVRRELIVMDNGDPTLYYNLNNPDPIDLWQETAENFTPTDYYKGIKSNVISQVLNEFITKKNIEIGTVLGVVNSILIVALGFGGYILFKEVMVNIEEIKLMFDILLGGY